MAFMIAVFVNKSLDGKDIPSYDEMFVDSARDTSEQDEKRMAFIRDQYIAFAEYHNKKRQEGALNDT